MSMLGARWPRHMSDVTDFLREEKHIITWKDYSLDRILADVHLHQRLLFSPTRTLFFRFGLCQKYQLNKIVG